MIIDQNQQLNISVAYQAEKKKLIFWSMHKIIVNGSSIYISFECHAHILPFN